MSYILDALKKAEAERNQGSVPGVHAQQPYAETPARPAAWRTSWPWASLAAVAAVGAALFMFLRPAPRPAVPPQSAISPLAATTPSSAAPAAAAPPPSLLPKEPPPPKPEAPAPRPRKEAAAPRAAEKPAPAAPAVKNAAPEAKPAGEAPVAEARIPALRELPQDIQSQIPALSVNGYLYADDKANRTVLINQRLLREGDQVAPDLKIEKLTPSGMVLNFRGHRYRSSY